MRKQNTLSKMALLVAILSLVCHSFSCKAQWGNDPAAPMVVSTNAGTPENMKAISDGQNGWYVLWRDKRTDGTHYEVFGQHLDEEGHAIWPTNGLLLLQETGGSVSEFTATRLGNGSIMIAYVETGGSFQDTLKVCKYSANGSALWSDPVSITRSGTILGMDQLAMIPVPNGAIIGWYDTYFGGSTQVNVTRITNAGEVLWEPDGYAIPGASYGPFNLIYDGASGVIVNWRLGNGIGAGFQAMRVDSTGTNAWPSNINPNAGGNGFGGNHRIEPGPDRSYFLAYSDFYGKVQLTQVDTMGQLVLNPSPVVACSFASSQNHVSLVHNGAYTYMAWGDNRPPASNEDLYVQKFDSDGNVLWDPEGVLGMHLNTYVPTTGIVASLDSGVIVTIDGNLDGYSAMRMNADGSLAWTDPVKFCTNLHNPFYTDQFQFPDGEGGIVSFWRGSTGTIYGGHIRYDGSMDNSIGIAEDRASRSLRIYPVPATDRITIQAGAAIQSITVRAVDGRSFLDQAFPHAQQVSLDISTLPAGCYLAEVRTAAGTSSRTILKE